MPSILLKLKNFFTEIPFFLFFSKEKQMVREPDAFKVDLAIEPNK
jgi:hypothetical protein